MSRYARQREVIQHTEAIIKQTFSAPPIASDSHVAAYPEMLRDAVIAGSIEGLKSEILAREWYLTTRRPGREPLQMVDESQAVRDLAEQLRSAELDNVLDLALDALTRGFQPFEQTWKWRKGKGFTINGLADVSPDQIGFNVDDQMRILSIVSAPTFGKGVSVGLERIWLHRHRGSRQYIAGRSILEPAWRPWYVKDQTIRLWGLQTQRYGMSHYIVRFPQSYTDSQKQEIVDAFYALLMDGVAGIPDDIAYEKVDPSYADGINFESAVQFQNSQIRYALYLEAQDSSPMGKSYTTGAGMQEMSKTRRYGLTKWAKELVDSFTCQVIAPLWEANYGKSSPCPRLHLRNMTDTDPDLQSLRQGASQVSKTAGA